MRTILSLKWDLLAIAILSIALSIWIADFEPIRRAADHAVENGSRPPDRTEGDVLLLLPDAPSDRARGLEELETSYAWYNALWQHHGSFASARLRDLSPELLAGRVGVIVPQLVGNNMSKNGFDALRGFVESGGELIVEMPSNDWSSFVQFAASGEPRKAAFAEIPNLPVDIPLFGKRIPIDSIPDDRILFRADKSAGMIRTTLGQGNVYSLMFEFGRSVIALQQGTPTKKLSFESKKTGSRSAVKPDARAFPIADLLEFEVLSVFGSERPLPTLWKFPQDYAGVAITLHPMFGTEISKTRAITSGSPGTLFLPPGFHENGSGCVWSDQQVFNQSENWVGLVPIQSETALVDQVKGCDVVVAKNYEWDGEWLLSLQRLAASDVRLDFSLAPSDERGGFAFGTTFPFYPIDAKGLPLPVLEMPVLLTESQIEALPTFMDDQTFPSPMTVSISAEGMSTSPSADSLLQLGALEQHAVERDFWIASPTEFTDFMYARRQTVLTSRWNGEDRQLVISVNLTKSLDVPAPTVAIPNTAPTFDGSTSVQSIVVDGSLVEIDTLALLEGQRIVQLEPGRHTLQINYEIPTIDEENDEETDQREPD